MLKKRNLIPEFNRANTTTLEVRTDLDQRPVVITDCQTFSLLDQPSTVINQQLKRVLAANDHPVLTIDEGDLRLTPVDFADRVNQRLANVLEGISAAAVTRLTIIYAPRWAAEYRLPADAQRIRIAHRQIRDLFQILYDQDTARHVQIIYGGFAFENEYTMIMNDLNVDGVVAK